MKRVALAVALLGITTAAAASPRDPAQEDAIDQAVSSVDPALVAKVHEGNDAMDRNDPTVAAKAYAVVHEKAPEVAAITRRLCLAEAHSGDSANAIAHCRAALLKEDTAENHAALASSLLLQRSPLPPDLNEALGEANAAVRRAPNAVFAQMTLCQAATKVAAADDLLACSTQLRSLAPKDPQTHLYAALAQAGQNDFDGADRELEEARAAGLDLTTYGKYHARFEQARPKSNVAVQTGTIVLASWLTLLFVMFVVGMLLSDSAERRAPSAAARAIYRAMIVVASALFYVSAAIGTTLLVGFLAVLVLAFLTISDASRKLQAAVGVASAYVSIAALRALLGRVPARELGVVADADEAAKLRKVVDAIAKRLHMPKLDAIHVEPDAAIHVVERGGVFGHLRGTNERVLVVGVAALEGLTIRQLEALVASELARFRSRDGAGGDLAIVERASLDELADRMEARGVASAGNPAWWFVRVYRAFFERITEGAVVFQEELADSRAAKAYGSAALVSALRHVARREVEIESRATASLRGVLEGTSSLDDVYTKASSDDLAEEIEDALADIAEREKRIEALAEEGYDESADAGEPAWSLFSDRKGLEAAMTERLRATLREHVGFEIESDQPSKAKAVARA